MGNNNAAPSPARRLRPLTRKNAGRTRRGRAAADKLNATRRRLRVLCVFWPSRTRVADATPRHARLRPAARTGPPGSRLGRHHHPRQLAPAALHASRLRPAARAGLSGGRLGRHHHRRQLAAMTTARSRAMAAVPSSRAAATIAKPPLSAHSHTNARNSQHSPLPYRLVLLLSRPHGGEERKAD